MALHKPGKPGRYQQFKGHAAAVKFSNGVVVMFYYDNLGTVVGGWLVGLPNHRFVQAATG